jgi:hypothetical protein
MLHFRSDRFSFCCKKNPCGPYTLNFMIIWWKTDYCGPEGWRNRNYNFCLVNAQRIMLYTKKKLIIFELASIHKREHKISVDIVECHKTTEKKTADYSFLSQFLGQVYKSRFREFDFLCQSNVQDFFKHFCCVFYINIPIKILSLSSPFVLHTHFSI